MEGDPAQIVVRGSVRLSQFVDPDYSEILEVAVDEPDVQPIPGTYSMENGTLVFKPRYPLVAGVRYIASYRLEGEYIQQDLLIPKSDIGPSTVVENVFPSSPQIPVNILKLYIHFSASMSRGRAFEHIRLVDEDGEKVELPFLELQEELWDPDLRRLTVLFDPGRIKRGLLPNEEIGLPLYEGQTYTLEIDQSWLDANGAPLKRPYKKDFIAGPADRQPLNPEQWQVAEPEPFTRKPVTIIFPEPVDEAMLQWVIQVTNADGDQIDGQVVVSDEETRWSFTPDKPWQTGQYALKIPGVLEDRAGNRVNRPFDVDTFEQEQGRKEADLYAVLFRVKSAPLSQNQKPTNH